MLRPISTLTAAMALAVGAVVAAPNEANAVTVTVRSATLVVPCGTGTGSTTADWYLPTGGPTAVVWVQHGFSRSRANVRDLATRLAQGTGAIVVAPNAGPCGGINATAFHQGIARLFGDQQARLEASYRAAHGLAAPALPEAYVLTGHSAGGNAVTAAAGFATDPTGDRGNLRGVVLYDPVQNGGAMATALAKVPTLPVATVSAPDSSCNASSSGTKALQAARPGQFVGFRLVRGSHTDAEGPNGDFLANLVCGFPRSENVAALRTLAVGWVLDMLSGTFGTGPNGRYAPPGQTVEVGSATAVSL